MKRTKNKANQAAQRLERLCAIQPTLAMVLGSGFGEVSEAVEVHATLPYAELPGFPPVGVAGHKGQVLAGHLGGTPVLVFSGRAHFYEGYPMNAVTAAVRTMAACGIQDLLLTNAAGGVNPKFKQGDFMLVRDHINFMGVNPLVGPAVADLPRFVDLSCAYAPRLQDLLRQAARLAKLKLREGVYLAVSGPSYETPAEIRAFARLGADAVGMSTVPETIVARQHGLNVAALSCITNAAAGVGGGVVSHGEVLEAAGRVSHAGAALLLHFARLYGRKN